MPKYAYSGSVANQSIPNRAAPGLAIRAEKLSLQAQIAALEEQLDYRASERKSGAGHEDAGSTQDLGSRLSRMAERYEMLETLDVAASQLERTSDFESAFAAIVEIVAALIGSEEVALYRTEQGAADLHLAASSGVQPPERIAVGAAPVGETARTGQEYLAPAPVAHAGESGESGISACMPLQQQGSTAWVLVIYGLLPQKQFLEKRDVEILRFLGNHAAAALGRKTEQV